MNLYPLIKLLSSESYLSGTLLGKKLGISRTAVWKQIQQLEKLGLEISTSRQQGYKLVEPLELFDEKIIKEFLAKQVSQLELRVYPSTSSTNDEAKKILATNSTGAIMVVAEMQTEGKGRRGKTWVSPFGHNLALTLGFKVDADISQLQGLSLAIAVELEECLAEFGELNLGFKWPNDVYLNNKKLCGILVEVSGDFSGPFNLVLGLGINLTTSQGFSQVDQPFACLAEAGLNPSKNLLAAKLAVRLERMLEKFLKDGFLPWQDRWNSKHLWLNKDAYVITANNKKPVILQGVNDSGELEVVAAVGKKELINSGEISLRLAE